MGKGIREKLGAKAKAQSCRGGEAEGPTREGGRSQPVERRGPGDATLPQALQSGIVHCPPTPQGSRQEGTRHREHRINSTGDRWTQNTLRMQGDGALNNMKQNKNKEKKIQG